MDPTALVLIFVELLNKVDQQKILDANFVCIQEKDLIFICTCTLITHAVTVLRQSRSIVPVSAWLTESKPSCFSRVFYYYREKRHPCIKSGNFGTY